MKNQNKECNGALYSGDGKVFLKLLNQECCYYAVENGTESISDNAFATLSFSNKTEFLDLPDSVTKLGSGAFHRFRQWAESGIETGLPAPRGTSSVQECRKICQRGQ